MKNRKLVIALFILVALVQIIVSATMVFNREDILNTGKEFKFITEPVDPNDPFRGKYIQLRFEENEISNPIDMEWEEGETVYTVLSTDDQGFAKIQRVSKFPPTEGEDYLKVKSRFPTSGGGSLFIDYPFDRYYMDEFKAPEAETIYRESIRDTARLTYALVSIKDGEAVLKDVVVDGLSIRDVVIMEQENHSE